MSCWKLPHFISNIYLQINTSSGDFGISHCQVRLPEGIRYMPENEALPPNRHMKRGMLSVCSQWFYGYSRFWTKPLFRFWPQEGPTTHLEDWCFRIPQPGRGSAHQHGQQKALCFSHGLWRRQLRGGLTPSAGFKEERIGCTQHLRANDLSSSCSQIKLL